tara:strand:- start:15461 stop:16156 length:696 start_codon:yes stop_codon:yes gene_type:complete
MKAIILAAGIGQRMSPLTKDKIPKSLLTVGNETLIGRQVRMLKSAGIQNIVIVTGFLSGKIKAHVKSVGVTFCHNRDFKKTTNTYSLSLASRYFDDDIIILLADVIFEERLLTELLKSNNQISILFGKKKCDREDVRVRINQNILCKISKDIPLDVCHGEFIGLATIKKKKLDVFKCYLEEGMRHYPNNNWHIAFQEMIDNGSVVNCVIANGFWVGCNRPSDYEEARRLFE